MKFGEVALTHLKKLEMIQNCAIRTFLQCPKTISVKAMQIEFNVPPIRMFIREICCTKLFKIKASPKASSKLHILSNNSTIASMFTSTQEIDGPKEVALSPKFHFGISNFLLN